MIPCECGRVHTGQTGRSVNIKLKNHQQHIRLEHQKYSALTEHSIDQRRRIQFHNYSIFSPKIRYMIHIDMQTIEIELRP
jgi:hypothetical protein